MDFISNAVDNHYIESSGSSGSDGAGDASGEMCECVHVCVCNSQVSGTSNVMQCVEESPAVCTSHIDTGLVPCCSTLSPIPC